MFNVFENEGEGICDKDMDKGIEDDDEFEKEMEEELEEEDEEEDGNVEYVFDFDESDEEFVDIEDWLGSEEEDDVEDDDDDEDDSEEDDDEEIKKKVGDKWKRGWVVKLLVCKRKEIEVEREIEWFKFFVF